MCKLSLKRGNKIPVHQSEKCSWGARMVRMSSVMDVVCYHAKFGGAGTLPTPSWEQKAPARIRVHVAILTTAVPTAAIPTHYSDNWYPKFWT